MVRNGDDCFQLPCQRFDGSLMGRDFRGMTAEEGDWAGTWTNRWLGSAFCSTGQPIALASTGTGDGG